MDKYEYKVRADEIKQLIAQGDYAQAADIADTIDWRRVKSVMMLCTISDLYKINRRYEDARDMLLLAYERRPGGRTICYSLCELSIKTEEYVQAVEYYKEFVQVAPSDPGRYILQYKIYEAQEVSLEERIEVLEELKKRDYREKWAYELAYLYHRVGLATRCVEECDELILWFGEGRYVVKAMELKMLHQPLTAEQQERYDHRFDAIERQQAEESGNEQEEAYQEEAAAEENYQTGNDGEEDYSAGDYRTGEYDEASYSAGDYRTGEYDEESYPAGNDLTEEYRKEAYQTGEYQVVDEENGAGVDRGQPLEAEGQTSLQNTRIYAAEESLKNAGDTEIQQNQGREGDYSRKESSESGSQQEEPEIHVKTMDMGQYNTMNLQAELAAGLREVLAEEDGKRGMENPVTRSIVAPMFDSETESLDSIQIEEVDEEDLDPETEMMESSEVFFGETEEIGDLPQEIEKGLRRDVVPEVAVQGKDVTQLLRKSVVTDWNARGRDMLERQAMAAQPPKELANVLAQESDGQISFVLPESGNLEKQITGQMSIEDILTEWERMKKQNQEKREQEVRKHVLEHTGDMFTEFEASVRDGLLEKLQKDEEIAQTEEDTLQKAPMAEEDVVEEPEEIRDTTDPEEEEIYEDYGESEALASESGEPEATPAVFAAAEKQQKEHKSRAEVPQKPRTDVILTKEFLEDDEEVTRDKEKVRSLTREERELYAPFIQSKASREQLIKAIDNISMASYTGNLVITGEEGMDILTLAKNVVREIQTSDSNFSGKVAKISGNNLNTKNVPEILEQLKNGALIIERTSALEEATGQKLYQ
ncbi:MAG: hypothetical protein NC081_12490, partial [Roseburia sp.]|nr:hypothetical protein [Roseburia sp.]